MDKDEKENLEGYIKALQQNINKLSERITYQDKLYQKLADEKFSVKNNKKGRLFDKRLAVLKLSLLGLVTIAIPAILILQADRRMRAEEKVAILRNDSTKKANKIAQFEKKTEEEKIIDGLRKELSQAQPKPININFPNGINFTGEGNKDGFPSISGTINVGSKDLPQLNIPNEITIKTGNEKSYTDSLTKWLIAADLLIENPKYNRRLFIYCEKTDPADFIYFLEKLKRILWNRAKTIDSIIKMTLEKKCADSNSGYSYLKDEIENISNELRFPGQ